MEVVCLFILHSIFYFLSSPCPPSYCSTSHTSSPPPCLNVAIPISHANWPLNSLGPPATWGLGTSSPNEHRPCSPLMYVCWWPGISWCRLPFGGPVFERSLESRLIETSGPTTGSPSSSASSSLSLIQQQGSSASVHWLGATICLWLFQLLVQSFRGQSDLAPFCELTIALVIVSVLGTSPWAGSHFGPVNGPSFLQVPLHFHPCNSFKNNYESDVWLWHGNPIPHLMSCFPPGGRLYKFSFSTVGHFIKGPSLYVLRVSHLPGLLGFCRVPPTSYLPRLSVSILSPGLQGFIPFPSPNTRSGSPLSLTPPSTFPPSSFPPFQLVIAFFYLPCGPKTSSHEHFSLL